MRARRAARSAVAAAVVLASSLQAVRAADDSTFDDQLAHGQRTELEGTVEKLRAKEPPAPLDANLVGVVSAWDIAGDAAADGVARYQDLVKSPGDPKRRVLEALCERVLRLGLLDPSVEHRSAAIEETEASALVRFIDPLAFVVGHDESDGLRAAAGHAMRRIGGRHARALLRADLRQDDVRTQRVAADELARMNDNSALRYLRKEARTGGRDDKLWAVERLSKLNDPAALPALAVMVQDTEDYYRSQVVRILYGYDDPRTIPVLRQALDDSYDEIRLTAAGALADLKDPTGLPVLRDFTKSVHPAQKIRAYEKLALLDDAESIPLIREGFASGDEMVKQQAAMALQKMGDPEARAYVASQHEGTFGSLGALAGALLAGRRAAPDQPPPPPPETVVETREADKYERAQSIRVLGEMGVAGVSGIRTGLADPDPMVRRTAVRALGKAGGTEDIDRLVPLLADPDVRARYASAGAILQILDK